MIANPRFAFENYHHSITYVRLQWDWSNPDTSVTEESVHISEVSSFQGLNCMQELFLVKEKVSLLERCPHFRGVLREGFHCIYAHQTCLHSIPPQVCPSSGATCGPSAEGCDNAAKDHLYIAPGNSGRSSFAARGQSSNRNRNPQE